MRSRTSLIIPVIIAGGLFLAACSSGTQGSSSASSTALTTASTSACDFHPSFDGVSPMRSTTIPFDGIIAIDWPSWPSARSLAAAGV